MSIVLKTAYHSSNPLLLKLIEDFNAFSSTDGDKEKEKLLELSIHDHIQPLINPASPQVASFDQKVGSLNMDMLDVGHGKFSYGKVEAYVQFLKFLYELRTKFVELNQLAPEQEYVLKQKQDRVVSPDIKAFEQMGNNKLDILHSPNSYSLIID